MSIDDLLLSMRIVYGVAEEDKNKSEEKLKEMREAFQNVLAELIRREVEKF